MRRAAAGFWDLPPAGLAPALAVSGAAFFLGGLGGCLMASWVTGGGSERLYAYLEGFLAAAGAGAVASPALAPLIWDTLRWPLLAVLLGCSALGVLGLPLLFAVRGFLLSFSIAAFVRMFGNAGCLLAFLVFGVSGCVAVPVLFVLGVQGLASACRLAAKRQPTEDRRNPGGAKAFLVRCGLCTGALGVCVLLEYLVVPALVAGMAVMVSS